MVQFVPFNKYESDETKLIEEVLEEIPRQVIEYYTLNFLYPDSLSNEDRNTKIIEPEKNLNNDSKIDTFILNGSYNPLMNAEYMFIKKNQIENNKNEKEFDNYSEINRKFSGKIQLGGMSSGDNNNSINLKKNYSINTQGSIISNY